MVVLANLALGDPDLQARVAAAGAISPLVGLLASDLEAMQMSAATALGNLALNASLRARLTSAGAVTALSRLLQSVSAAVQEPAARALMGLAHENDAQARAIAAAGGIPPLVHLLRSDSTTASATPMLALRVLTTLAAEDGSPRDISIIRKAGALPLLEKLKGNARASAFIREDAASLIQLLQHSPSDTLSAQRADTNSAAPLPSFSASSLASPSFSTPLTTAAAIAVLPTLPFPAPTATAACPTPSPAPTEAAAGPTPSPAPTAAAACPSPSSAPGLAGASRQSNGRTNKLCWSCGATGVPLKKCSMCAVAAYCGGVCQKADWKAHKGQCAGLKAGAAQSSSAVAGGT